MQSFQIRLRLHPVIIVATFVLVVLAAPAQGGSCHLSVGWEPWKPYQFRSAEGELTGLDVEIMRAAVERLDCTLEYHQLPWERTLFEVEQGGLATVAAGADRTDTRERYAFFSKPYRTESVRLFVRKDQVNRFVLEDLSDIRATGFRLGVTAGYHYGDAVKAHMKDPAFAAQVESVRSDRQNHKKLMLGRIDGFLADPTTTDAIAQGKEYRHELVPHPITVKEDDIHVMFSRKVHSRDIVQRFNKALSELRESGQYQALMDQYLAD